jgi:SAM-dependent methyltransferase
MDLVSRYYARDEPLRQRIRDLARNPGARTLDVGCKHGELSTALADCVGWLAAVDLETHDAWRERRDRVSFVAGDAMALPFRDASFDQIVSAECLQFVVCPETALDEFHRVLRRGGQLILSFPADGPFSAWLNPYNLASRVRGRPARRRQPRRRILGHLARGWRRHDLVRRGTWAFIYAAWLIDQLHSARLVLARRGAIGRAVAQALRPAILLLFAVMRLDFRVALGALSYNTIVRLEKVEPRSSPP